MMFACPVKKVECNRTLCNIGFSLQMTESIKSKQYAYTYYNL